LRGSRDIFVFCQQFLECGDLSPLSYQSAVEVDQSGDKSPHSK